MTPPIGRALPIVNCDPKDVKIKLLEGLLAIEIDRAAKLLKENQKLEASLQNMKCQRDCWRKLYRKIKPNKKVPCDRQNAMVVHGEIDISEVLHMRMRND